MVVWNPKFLDDAFRPLFLVGYVLGFLGLGVWLLNVTDPSLPYPGRGHAMLTMQGFLYALSFGILLTDIPDRLGISTFPRIPLAILTLLFLGMGACALNLWLVLGESLFLGGCLLVSGYLMQSLFLAKKSLGPDFLFLATAPVVALTGSALRIAAGTGLITDPRWDRLGALAIYQGFFLLFALGTMPAQSSVRGNVKIGEPALRWNVNVALVVLLAASLVLEAFSTAFENPLPAVRTAYLLRVIIVGWLLFLRTGPEPLPLSGAAHPRGVILGLFAILFGMGLPALFPWHAVGLSHFAYVAGFAWLVLDQAARVLEGRFALSSPVKGWGNIILFGSLLLIGALMRITAEYVDSGRTLLLILAVFFILAPLLAWTWRNLPFLGNQSIRESNDSTGM